jgi:GAF domain-containing protein
MTENVTIPEVFVEFADTLVDDFDLLDFLDLVCRRCVQLFPAAASGLMLRDHSGDLHVLASSNEESRLVELFQLQNDEGPCLDSISNGARVHADTADEIMRRWPRFGARVEHRFGSVYALPLRLRSETIGGLNLFAHHPHALDADQLRVAQALADTATIGIIQQRSVREATVLSEQLQNALNSRVLIEQAKGIHAERNNTDMGNAFEALRTYSRNHNMPLRDVAERYVAGSIDLSES